MTTGSTNRLPHSATLRFDATSMGAEFVAPADQRKEQVRRIGVQRQAAEFVDDHQRRLRRRQHFLVQGRPPYALARPATSVAGTAPCSRPGNPTMARAFNLASIFRTGATNMGKAGMPVRAAAEKRLRRLTLRQLEAWLELPMIVLSFAWLLLVVLELIWGAGRAFELFGLAIWAVFVAEFLVRLTLAPEKLTFVTSNWLTLVALLLPALRAFAALRFLRVARAARGLRLVRVIGTANRGMNALRNSMSRRGLGYLVLLTVLIVLLGAAGMLALEPALEVPGGFANYAEALWWTAMLLTTMGTDFWPRTAEGRLLCLLLAIYAFAVWGYITASIATFFIGQEARSRSGELAGANELAALRSEIASLRKDLSPTRIS